MRLSHVACTFSGVRVTENFCRYVCATKARRLSAFKKLFTAHARTTDEKRPSLKALTGSKSFSAFSDGGARAGRGTSRLGGENHPRSIWQMLLPRAFVLSNWSRLYEPSAVSSRSALKRLCKPRMYPLTTRVPHLAGTHETHKTLDKSSFLRDLPISVRRHR
jgi:hypothetical protein